MQFRFREYDKETSTYQLVTIIDIDDYDVMYKALLNIINAAPEVQIEFMKDNNLNTEGELYDIISVSLCIGDFISEDALLPYFGVDVEKYY